MRGAMGTKRGGKGEHEEGAEGSVNESSGGLGTRTAVEAGNAGSGRVKAMNGAAELEG